MIYVKNFMNTMSLTLALKYEYKIAQQYIKS
jgi:hypothetical protein